MNRNYFFRQNAFFVAFRRKLSVEFENLSVADVLGWNVVGGVNFDRFFVVVDDGGTAGYKVAELKFVAYSEKN